MPALDLSEPASSALEQPPPMTARARTNPAVRARIAAPLVAAGIACSSFLLFVLEPLVGRLVLPVYGGAPASWATVLVFFQATLLLGYLYGHISVTRLGPRVGPVVHVALVALAAVALGLAPAHLGAISDPHADPILDVLRVLVISIGPPAFVLTTTTPLLSAWFARLRGHDSDDPYWLYAASNGASFLALVAYPFLIEPISGLAAQRTAWSAGFVGLGILLSAVAALVVAWGSDAKAVGADATAETDAMTLSLAGVGGMAPALQEPSSRIAMGRRLRWLVLATIPAGLLSAVTNLVATDLVAAPLLWVGPLAIYLISFVIAFSARGRRIVGPAILLAPVAVTLLWVPIGSVGAWPIVPLVIVAYLGFGVIATALHGHLALDRPPASNLTEFYLVLSVGGVLGGAFVGVLAPMAFRGIWEYPILLVAALGALAWGGRRGDHGSSRPATAEGSRARGLDLMPFVVGARRRLIPYGIVAAILIATVAPVGLAVEPVVRWLGVGALVLLVGGQPRFLALATGVLLVLVTFVLPGPALLQERSFFGVTRVVRTADAIQLLHGTTLHGLQVTDPALRDAPTGYYVASGPAGDVFASLRARSAAGLGGSAAATSRGAGAGGAAGARSAEPSIGIVGLGDGGLAAYAQSGDHLTFYEIDPVVVRVAEDPTLFTYLTASKVRPQVVVGDGRLSLAAVPDASHDLLVFDAFSSDSPPAHLLTVEALQDAMRTIRPGGLLVLHLSNRYYDLSPAISGAASQLGLASLGVTYTASGDAVARYHGSSSIWIALARSPDDLSYLAGRGWSPVPPAAPLTDDQPDLLRFLRLLGG